MEALTDIGGWIAQNEALLSGLAALIVVGGVVFTPLGAGLRRLLGSREEGAPGSTDAGEPVTRDPIAEPREGSGTEAAAGGPSRTGPPSIAVLPLASMSSEPDHEFLADGLSEDITTALAANHHLNVISRNSTFAYKGQSPDIREVGQALGARYVLEGSVRPVGDALRVTVQLIASEDGMHVFAQKIDVPSKPSAETQDGLVSDIAGALWVRVIITERERSASISDEEAETWDLLMKGTRGLTSGSPSREQLDEAVRTLARSVELEPNASHTRACYAWVHFVRIVNGWEDDIATTFRVGREHLAEALRYDGSDSLTQGFVACACMYSGAHARAVRFFEKSLESNPHQPDLIYQLGLSLAYLGRFAEAHEAFDRADRVTDAKMRANTRWYRGITLCMEERFEEAIEVLDGVADQYPRYAAVSLMQAIAHEGIGDTERARRLVERAHEIDPHLHLPGIELQLRAHPDPEKANARVEMLHRYWPTAG